LEAGKISALFSTLMKKLTICLSLLGSTIGASQAQAPIKAGTVLLGGGINYLNQSEDTKQTVGNTTYMTNFSRDIFTFSPYLGYFVADNLAVGLNVSFASDKAKSTSTPVFGTAPADPKAATAFRIGPFVQSYKMLTDQFGFTGTLGAGYQTQFQPARNSGSNNNLDYNTSGYYASLTPGLIFLPIPRLGLGASIGGLGYNRLTTKPDNAPAGYNAGDDTASSFGASFGLAQLTFSGTYFFGR